MPLVTDVMKQRRLLQKLYDELKELPEEDVRNMIVNEVVDSVLTDLGSKYSRSLDKNRWAIILKLWQEQSVSLRLKEIERKIIEEMY